MKETGVAGRYIEDMDVLRNKKSLAGQPSHGYRLHKEVGVATSTIYDHLNELEDAGMVESSDVDESSRNKTEYRITDQDRQLLELLDQ